MFRKLLTRARRATTWASCCAAPSAKTSSAARCCRKPGSVKPHTHFTAEIYVLSKEGRPPHAVLQQLPAAVLLPHHGRDRRHRTAGGQEMVMPGDNVSITVKLIAPIAMEEGPALCHPAKAAAPSAPASWPRSSRVTSGSNAGGVAQLAERRSPKPKVGVRSLCPATTTAGWPTEQPRRALDPAQRALVLDVIARVQPASDRGSQPVVETVSTGQTTGQARRCRRAGGGGRRLLRAGQAGTAWLCHCWRCWLCWRLAWPFFVSEPGQQISIAFGPRIPRDSKVVWPHAQGSNADDRLRGRRSFRHGAVPVRLPTRPSSGSVRPDPGRKCTEPRRHTRTA